MSVVHGGDHAVDAVPPVEFICFELRGVALLEYVCDAESMLKWRRPLPIDAFSLDIFGDEVDCGESDGEEEKREQQEDHEPPQVPQPHYVVAVPRTHGVNVPIVTFLYAVSSDLYWREEVNVGARRSCNSGGSHTTAAAVFLQKDSPRMHSLPFMCCAANAAVTLPSAYLHSFEGFNSFIGETVRDWGGSNMGPGNLERWSRANWGLSCSGCFNIRESEEVSD